MQKHVIDVAAKVDHAVDGVHAHGHQAAARRLGLVGPPMRRFQEQRIGERHGRFDVQNSAERAAFDLFAQPRHFGMKAPVVAEAERDAGLAHGCDRAFGFLFGQRERLFAEHVFLRRRRRDHLRGMHGMRRRQHHRVDRRIGEDQPRSSEPA